MASILTPMMRPRNRSSVVRSRMMDSDTMLRLWAMPASSSMTMAIGTVADHTNPARHRYHMKLAPSITRAWGKRRPQALSAREPISAPQAKLATSQPSPRWSRGKTSLAV